MNIQNNKNVFINVFGKKGQNSWTDDYKKKYIYKIQKEFELTSNKLPLKIINNYTDVNKIYNEIIKYDDDLSIFLSFHKNYETLAKKTVELYNIQLSDTEKQYIKNDLETLPYNNSKSKDWGLFEIDKNINKVTILIGKTAYQTRNIEIPEDKIDSKLWTTIQNTALEMTNNSFNNLIKIKTSLSEERRLVSKVVFDFENDIVEIGIDNSYFNEDGTKITKTEQLINKQVIMKEVSENLNLTNDSIEKLEQSIENKVNSLFTKNVFKALTDYRDDNLIIIPKLRDYYKTDDDIEEYNEHLRVEQKNQRLEDIKKNVSEYYTENGKLEGFFEKYTQHDTIQADITNQFEEDEDINSTHYHAFAILVRDVGIYEKSNGEYKMTNKVIDSISFDFNLINKEIDIKNNSYSKEIYEAIISKVLEFNKQ